MSVGTLVDFNGAHCKEATWSFMTSEFSMLSHRNKTYGGTFFQVFGITLNNGLVHSAKSRYLGVVKRVDLSWLEHYSHNIYSKSLKRDFQSPTNLKKQLYISLVQSHLCYCSQIRRPCLIKDITNIERIQRKATNTRIKTRLTTQRFELQASKMTLQIR